MTKKDDKLLKRFCKSIKHDEISLESWESCMTALNLTVPVFLSSEEALAGADKTIKFTRTHHDPPRKEPAQVVITIPPKAADGLQLKCSGLGDARCDSRGDLLVIVRIKS